MAIEANADHVLCIHKDVGMAKFEEAIKFAHIRAEA